MEKQRLRLYLAGPLGFTEAGRAFHQELLTRLEKASFEVLDPWRYSVYTDALNEIATIPLSESKREAYVRVNKNIALTNIDDLRACDLVVAVLDGTDVDSGTAWEMGYAHCLGRPIFGYRGDLRQAGENIGSVVNLQVQVCLRNSRSVARTVEDLLLQLVMWRSEQ